jgi:hypothetical protein
MNCTCSRIARTTLSSIATLAAILMAADGCAKHDASPPATSGDSAAASNASTASSAASPATVSGITPVRGTLVSVSDTALTVSTATGDITVAVQPPLQVYSSGPAKLASVTPHSFVGVTSVAQPDGSQLATEIHLFPEALRGTGEGSYLMTQQPGGANGKRSTMTNGTVQASPAAKGPPRMTNGTIASQGTGTITVQYQDGSQTITIPSGVSVTAIAPVDAKLASGAKVIVLATKQPDGAMKASNVLLARPDARAKQQ